MSGACGVWYEPTRASRPINMRITLFPPLRRRCSHLVVSMVKAALRVVGALMRGPVLRFENVGLRYGMGAEVVGDVSFDIAPQSFQFLTGPSGAGKTTLLRLMLLSLRPTRGTIEIFGADSATLGKDA